MKPQKQSPSRPTKDSRQGKKARATQNIKLVPATVRTSFAVAGPARARPSSCWSWSRCRPSAQYNKNTANAASVQTSGVEAGADQVLDTAKAPPTPPPNKPTAVEAGADQVLDTTKASPAPPPYKPAAVEAGADQVLDTTKAPPTPPPYKPTAQEQVYLARQERREGSTPPAPRLNFAHDHRGMRLMTDHPDPTIVKKLIMETLGTADPAFFAGLKQQLIDLTGGESEEEVTAFNFAPLTSSAVGLKMNWNHAPV